MDFGAEDAGRLPPFKDDKPKDAENSPFEASSVLVVKATALNQMLHTMEHNCCSIKMLYYFVRNRLSFPYFVFLASGAPFNI